MADYAQFILLFYLYNKMYTNVVPKARDAHGNGLQIYEAKACRWLTSNVGLSPLALLLNET